ncbi:hypothetical protein [Candidatus Nitrosarchaeum limnium]|nr:hypothetical protein [Candidatus Nitrosarchaeum limnium]
MNMYDTKIVICINCKKPIGEIELDSTMDNPLCGQCALEESFSMTKSRIKIAQVM